MDLRCDGARELNDLTEHPIVEMPADVAVDGPNARIIRCELCHNPALRRNDYRVALYDVAHVNCIYLNQIGLSKVACARG